jgi:hypothetical protein
MSRACGTHVKEDEYVWGFGGKDRGKGNNRET